MKKQIITLTVAALTLSSCGIYTQYKQIGRASCRERVCLQV